MKAAEITLALASTLDYFRLATMVLQRFVSKRGVALSVDQLAREFKAKSDDVSDVCTCLAATGVIVHTPDFQRWSLAADPAEVTLEEVWRAIGGLASVMGPDSADCDDPFLYKVDLLTSQAFLGLDQSISAHLRRFRLDSVQTAKQRFVDVSTTRKYEPDIDSPVHLPNLSVRAAAS